MKRRRAESSLLPLVAPLYAQGQEGETPTNDSRLEEDSGRQNERNREKLRRRRENREALGIIYHGHFTEVVIA